MVRGKILLTGRKFGLLFDLLNFFTVLRRGSKFFFGMLFNLLKHLQLHHGSRGTCTCVYVGIYK